MEQSVRNHREATNLFRQLAGSKKFSSELNDLIDGQGVKVTGHTLFVTKDISSMGGKNALLDENTKRVIGVSNISGNRLPKNQAFIFDKMCIEHGVGDTTKPGGVAFETAFPAELQNSEVVLRQGGNVILQRSVSDFYAKGTAQSPEQKILDLESPQVLRDDEAIDFELHVPAGVSIPDAASAGNELLARFKMLGYITRRA